MPLCNFDKITGQFHSGCMHAPLAFDTLTEVQLLLPTYPDARTQRLNVVTSTLRDATAAEIAAYDDARVSPLAKALDAVIQAPIPSTEQLKAVFTLMRQQIT